VTGESSGIHSREEEAEECICKPEGKRFYTKLIDKCKITKSQSIFLDIKP